MHKVPIIDRNGKPTHVWRKDSTPLSRGERISKLIKRTPESVMFSRDIMRASGDHFDFLQQVYNKGGVPEVMKQIKGYDDEALNFLALAASILSKNKKTERQALMFAPDLYLDLKKYYDTTAMYRAVNETQGTIALLNALKLQDREVKERVVLLGAIDADPRIIEYMQNMRAGDVSPN